MNNQISLHVITMYRDDELFRLLAVCKDRVGKMRVCDGSGEEKTRLVCESIGAEYYYRQWDDDYSAQDNRLLEEASGDYDLILFKK